MELQGWVVAAMAVLCLGVLVPTLAQGRGVLADSRMEDRHSSRLRIVTTGGSAHFSVLERRGWCAAGGGSSSHPRRKAVLVTRRTDLRTASAADARALAVARAHLAARRSRRAAGRRRRNVLNLTLIAVTVVVWALGLTTAMSAWWALLPLAVTAGSIVMSRRADLAAAGRDRNDRAELDALEERLRIDTRRSAPRPQSARPAELTGGAKVIEAATAVSTVPSTVAVLDEADAGEVAQAAEPGAVLVERDGAEVRLGDADPEGAETAEQQSGPSGSHAVGSRPALTTVDATTQDATPRWTPAPVPAPVYSLKATAAPRTVEPYVAPEAPAAGSPLRPTEPAKVTAPLGSPVREQLDREKEKQSVPAPIDLDSVMARRRAAGA